jgi:DNA modification methylase
VTPYYQDEAVTIYHSDCRNVEVIADYLVTDPPYGMAYKSGWSHSTVCGDEDTSVRDFALEKWRLPSLVFGRWDVQRPSGVKCVLIWDKGDWPGMGDLSMPWGPSTEEIYVIGSGFVGRRKGSILRDTRRPCSGSFHPTQKPVGLMSQLVGSCPCGSVVVDPFMGSGSTLVAAKSVGRRAVGIEIDERYCEVAARRLSQGVIPLGSDS